jgi:lactate dehydrogenase-like 2-hydroxyacid dehydrogenase
LIRRSQQGLILAMAPNSKPAVLIRVEHRDEDLDRLREVFEVHYAPSAEQFAEAAGRVGPTIRGIITNGSFGVSGEHIRAMPDLEIVLARGVGYEKIDVEAAKERGVIVANGQGLNSHAVADHAMGLLLSLVRRIPSDDRAVREGRWDEVRGLRPIIHEKWMGILGLGGVGAAVAMRALGFGMQVGYHSRSVKPDVPHAYFDSVRGLAEHSDVLVVAVPGGPDTRGMVDRDVLAALGPAGFLVNVGRGSVVDNDVLAEALSSGIIAGAAIDVVDGEPAIPDRLLQAPNLLITPHTGGLSPEIMVLANRQVLANLTAHFAGRPVTNRVA